jgi:hypothetical protein
MTDQFTKYNTDGWDIYTANQLDELNRRADKALNGIDLDDPDSAGEVEHICEKILTAFDNEQTWKLGTRYSTRRPWEIEIFSSLDDLLVEFNSLSTDGPEISIDLFIGDAPIENVKVEYTVGCRETGTIFDVFPEIDRAKKAIIDFEKSDTDAGNFEPDFYSYWAVADKEKTGGFETSTI